MYIYIYIYIIILSITNNSNSNSSNNNNNNCHYYAGGLVVAHHEPEEVELGGEAHGLAT